MLATSKVKSLVEGVRGKRRVTFKVEAVDLRGYEDFLAKVYGLGC